MARADLMLLDTCGLLWLSQGGGKLSAACLQRIAGAPELCISAITAFEIAIKVRSGKLTLPATPVEWLRTVVAHHGIQVIPLDERVCITAVELPDIHRDPCDRFIIATARLHRWPVVTSDAHFAQYGVIVIV